MEVLRAVPLDRARPQDRGYLGSHPIQYPEEVMVALALVELGYDWQYETVTLREQVMRDDGSLVTRGATCDFFLPRLDVFLEVKLHSNPDFERSGAPRSNKGRQRRMALQAGYGFAVIFRLHYDPVVLRRKVEAAIAQAVAAREIARRTFPDWQERRVWQAVVSNFLIIPTQHAVAV